MKPIDRARRYVAKMPAAVSGQGGHTRTFHVACVIVQGFALSGEDAWTVLCDYNERCAPPWTEVELRHKLEDALKAPSSKERGYLLHTPRIPFAPGLVRPATGARPCTVPVPMVPRCPATAVPLHQVLQAKVHQEELSGTLGTLVSKSHVYSIPSSISENTDHISRAYTRKNKHSVPSVPNFLSVPPVSQLQSQQDPPLESQSTVSDSKGLVSDPTTPLEYQWPPPGTTDFDQETGHPIIDGKICPF